MNVYFMWTETITPNEMSKNNKNTFALIQCLIADENEQLEIMSSVRY